MPNLKLSTHKTICYALFRWSDLRWGTFFKPTVNHLQRTF